MDLCRSSVDVNTVKSSLLSQRSISIYGHLTMSSMFEFSDGINMTIEQKSGKWTFFSDFIKYFSRLITSVFTEIKVSLYVYFFIICCSMF